MNHQIARVLRKNMTDVEKRLWQELRFRQLDGHKFRRQVPIGNYVVDFACFEKRLVLELDGSQHGEQERDDAKRTQWLNSQGFRVIRFWNHEVGEDMDSVLQVIWDALHDDTPHPNPPPQGGREPEKTVELGQQINKRQPMN